ncbi:TonB-dependent receptor domain-containing protein [Longimicrobium terrae]|uniref:Iron complex outermembrane receptor protein n=1 Tax=Longimicrobium terrae TaxID=1639882 RepID=A0A841H3E4_9BACT|nr:iron complex outermembrane receptor protein [Longimicrobium terrae]MBB6072488.1 iron complex outermembrane receptor protein [Longimicrobium terrae]NNC32101.1 TonB-dependent receptor [Longimicrobium terrae]
MIRPVIRPLICAAVLLLCTAFPATLVAQDSVRVTVVVRAEGEPVADATVRADSVIVRTTDASGTAVLGLAPGRWTIRVGKMPFMLGIVTLTAARDTTVTVDLQGETLELEEIIVTSTRTGRRLEDEPTRVEVLSREEVEEKMMMTPGDVSMMLNETSGLRVQTTSPSLGGANVRVQGLRGRYTQILSDGLPLYGGQSGALGLLQIPPMDLGQVEVIKGAASALYGSSALGGVVNLISRRPGDEAGRELLLNQTTRNGTDVVGFASAPLSEQWGYTLLASAHRQSEADVDGDRWTDMPGYERAVVRPRLFWDDGEGRSLFLTAGATAENREGGGRVPGGDFAETLRTRRGDVGALGRFLFSGDRLLTVRASGMAQRHAHGFGDVTEDDLHSTGFAEAAWSGTARQHTWVAGAALQTESYRADDVAGFDYTYTTPSLFGQEEYAPAEWITFSLAGRADWHSEYGAFFNPRLSLLLRPAGWTVRGSVGTGYFAPTPFTEETEAIGLTRVLPLSDALEPERARTASLDVGRTVGALEMNATLFGSRTEHALQLVQSDAEAGMLALVNADGPTRTWGTELLARWHREPFHVTATHTWLRSREHDPEGAGRREVSLTPRHALGLVGMWEAEETGRLGGEFYYTGRQTLEDNPFRDASRPYLIVGLLAERRIGPARAFINLENLLDVRQTRWDPLVLPARSREGRWTTDAWGPLEGRVINAGVRLDL